MKSIRETLFKKKKKPVEDNEDSLMTDEELDALDDLEKLSNSDREGNDEEGFNLGARDATIPDTYGHEGVINPLELADKTLTPSQVVRELPEIMKEIKIGFLDDPAINEIRHSGVNYDRLRYVMKILQMQYKEDQRIIKNKKTLYQIRDKKQLKKYLKSINRSYLYNIIRDNGDIQEILKIITELKPSGIADDLQNISDNLKSIYKEYNKENKKSKYMDDSGMLQKIGMEATLSSGRKGNERYALVSTIQATRNIDMKKDTEIERPIPIVSSVKRTVRKFL